MIETMQWTQIASEFDERDGSLRDIYVLGTDEVDWDNVLAQLHEFQPPPIFTVDGVVRELPTQAGTVFSIRDKHAPMLTVMVGQVALNCHFFWASDIEFDFDPRHVTGLPQAEALTAFMKLLGKVTQKRVILCHENSQHLVIARFSPCEDKAVWVGTTERIDGAC